MHALAAGPVAVQVVVTPARKYLLEISGAPQRQFSPPPPAARIIARMPAFIGSVDEKKNATEVPF